MPDMLVRLYALPAAGDALARLAANGVTCRRAESYERTAVLDFVRCHWPAWGDEMEAAYARVPPTACIAVQGGKVIGFAAFNATRPGLFGPTGVLEAERKRGIGRVLLIQCLEALAAEGYAYAIIGGVGPAEFYARAVGATIIEGSEPGIYVNHVRSRNS